MNRRSFIRSAVAIPAAVAAGTAVTFTQPNAAEPVFILEETQKFIYPIKTEAIPDGSLYFFDAKDMYMRKGNRWMKL